MPPLPLNPQWLAVSPPIVVLVFVLGTAVLWLARENRSYRKRTDLLSLYLIDRINLHSDELSSATERLPKLSRKR